MPMFETYFGFRENPFKLERDISYLFWGQHHEEAVAHLRYAVIEGEGFIAITGERGVGKTIICRSFIDNLNRNEIAAYIDNPVGSSEELLKNINAQFKIRHKAQSVKELTDSLNKFLMQKKLAGKKVAVFVDDAQLLKKDSLEQMRLISNLETSRDKLIQIVLVDEPRLTEMLASHDLRQIGQRISVKYHIYPFNYSETIAYIQHRISIASKGPPILFDQQAFQHIFKYSRGIPRAINIACNRALMEAFNRKETRITGDIAQEAVGFLSTHSGNAIHEYFKRKGIRGMIVGCSILLAITVSAYFFHINTLESSRGHQSNKRPNEMPSPDIAATHMRDGTLIHPERTGIVESPAEPMNETISAKSTPSLKMTHSVQAGAFLNIEYAEEVVAQLKSKGYPAQIIMVKDSIGRSWYTVRIGDYPSKEEAQAEADAFSTLEKMETAVRPFGKL
jgi:general secretion pathway protein A